MPLIRIGRTSYKWGKYGAVYRGTGARQKALRQGKAIQANKGKKLRKKGLTMAYRLATMLITTM